jgi:hypothetical protein
LLKTAADREMAILHADNLRQFPKFADIKKVLDPKVLMQLVDLKKTHPLFQAAIMMCGTKLITQRQLTKTIYINNHMLERGEGAGTLDDLVLRMPLILTNDGDEINVLGLRVVARSKKANWKKLI